MGLRLKLSKIEHIPDSLVNFRDRISSFKDKEKYFDSTYKKIEIFEIPKDDVVSTKEYFLIISSPFGHLFCTFLLLLLSLYFYRCNILLNVYLQEVRMSLLKQIIQNVILLKNSKQSVSFIEFYREAAIEWKTKAKESEGLIRRYNNAACKNEFFETKILQMEDLQIKAMLKDFNID